MSTPDHRPQDAAERKEIRIRWRRYGKQGGRWRADLPPGNGIDSGLIESESLHTVEDLAYEIGHRYGYPVIREEAKDA